MDKILLMKPVPSKQNIFLSPVAELPDVDWPISPGEVRVTFMKYLVLLSFLTFSFHSFATCKVFVPERAYTHAGYDINFDFTKILTKKNYEETLDLEAAKFLLLLKGSEREERFFHYADAALILENISGREVIVVKKSVRCMGQMCAVADFAKAFQKAYKSFDQKIMHCQDFFVGLLK
jgi:hypothetical protein